MFSDKEKIGRFGFTLLELLVAFVAGLVILGAAGIFLVRVYSHFIDESKKLIVETSVLKLSSLITSDLLKAGYNVPKGYNALDWNGDDKTLTIRYVDYTKFGCSAREFKLGDSCSYVVEYRFTGNNILRRVDESADGDFEDSVLFDDKKVEITDFNVVLYPSKQNVFIKVSYRMLGGKVKTLEFLTNCPNWN